MDAEIILYLLLLNTMNRFSYFIAACMVLSGLLISGCRKDAWDDIDKISTTNPSFDGYHPKFDTILHRANGFSGGAGSTVIAPTTLQLADMKTAIDWTPYGSPLSLKISELYDAGQRIDINYGMLFPSDNPEVYMIAMPFMHNNDVSSIVFYYHDNTEQDRFLLVEKHELISRIQQNGTSLFETMPAFSLIAGAFNTIQISKDSTYNATVNTWLDNYIDNKRESNNIGTRDILTICANYYSFNLVGGTEYITVWEECYSTSTGGTPNGFFGLTNFGTGDDSGRGGSGGEGGSGDQNSDGPVLAGECWNNISRQAQDAIIEVMESYYAPCPEEQDAVNQAIQDVIADLCAEINSSGKVLGTGYEAINLDKSTVTHRVMNKLGDKVNDALEGNPYIKLSPNLLNDCPKLNCILNNLLNGIGPESHFLCDMLSKFDGNPKFEIGSGVPKSNEPNFDGKTFISLTGNSIGIMFNKNKCESMNGINLFETFQHELVHADFFRRLIEDYNWTGNSLTLDASFKTLVAAKYGANATPDMHILMLNQILPDMINSLMEANGSTLQCTGFEDSGDCKHFKTLIINGFSAELLETQLGISLEQHILNANEYSLWKLRQPLFINLNTCQ